MPGRELRPLVLKLGGAALDRPGLSVARVRSRRRQGPVVVVVSARAGVTDALQRAAKRGGPPDPLRSVRRTLVRRYGRRDPRVVSLLDRAEPLRRSCSLGGAVGGRARHELLALGERLSAHWFSELLSRAGIPAVAQESDRIGLIVGGTGRQPRIDLRGSRTRVRAALARCLAQGSVPVLTGYFGADRAGAVRTLGRGSSDYVAAAVASLVEARGLEIVKRGGPLRAVDPMLLPGAPVIGELSYRTAQRAVANGWTVVHPLALAPVRRRGIPVRVTGLKRGDRDSVISTRGGQGHPVLLLQLRARAVDGRSPGRFRLIGPRRSELRARLLRSRAPPGLRVHDRGGTLELLLPRRTTTAQRRRWLARLVAERALRSARGPKRATR